MPARFYPAGIFYMQKELMSEIYIILIIPMLDKFKKVRILSYSSERRKETTRKKTNISCFSKFFES